MFRGFIGIVVLVFSIASFAEAPVSYLLPIVRNGKTTVRVARNFWSGEYPTPIIDVMSKTKGTTKIQAYKSLRDISKSENCTILNGIYHPWSKSKGSVLEYYQIVSKVEYTAEKNVKIENTELKKGDKISREIYLSEGNCEGVLISKKKKETRLEYSCDSAKGAGLVQTSGKEDKFEEQWIQVSCTEGFKAFVRDEALLKIPGVTTGKLIEYGKVGSSEDEGQNP